MCAVGVGTIYEFYYPYRMLQAGSSRTKRVLFIQSPKYGEGREKKEGFVG
jgi:hypothetical protein